MTLTTTKASYADVLHRLSLGEEIVGEAFHRLPEIGLLPAIDRDEWYTLSLVPEVLQVALSHAIRLEPDQGHEAFLWSAYRIYQGGVPLPLLFRTAVWQAGAAADVAIGLLDKETEVCQLT